MIQQVAYQAMKNYIATNGITLTQVQNTTPAQVNNLLGTSYNEGFLVNVLAYIITKMQEDELVTDRQFFKAQFDGGARVAVRNRWPLFQITREPLLGERPIVLWTGGKPVAEDD